MGPGERTSNVELENLRNAKGETSVAVGVSYTAGLHLLMHHDRAGPYGWEALIACARTLPPCWSFYSFKR